MTGVAAKLLSVFLEEIVCGCKRWKRLPSDCSNNGEHQVRALFIKIHCYVRRSGTFLRAEVYILFSLILIDCYHKLRNFVVSQNLQMVPS